MNLVIALAVLAPLSLAAQEQAAHSDETHGRRPLPAADVIAELPPDGGPEFNRLVFESSPYLRQHARNPVDWYPWGAEAFERARAQDRPVFLSIGYSTCHWCHVMEHESFEDAQVAALMNEHFVCIKVDREERPDVDQVYMTVTQGLTGRGGWPMTVVMTPDRLPFFAGTYFPKADRVGQPGMLTLVPELARMWREEREQALARAGQLGDWLAEVTAGTPGRMPTERTLDRALTLYRERFDGEHGGFGRKPKFPTPHNLRLLLRLHRRTGDPQALAMVETTLDAMRRGGIWDHVGFGFHRYSTDRRWLLPHFEKMLYDQALIAMAYTEAWQVTGEPAWRRTTEEIFAYVLRDMTAPEGGFYSAEDADSEGEEGLFYVWTTAELEAVLGEDDGRLAADVFGARADGNFKEEATGAATGRNVLHLGQSLADYAAEHDLDPAELAARVESIRARLFEAREPRVHPLLDDKVLTDWNGLMIAALAQAGRAFGDQRYVDAARAAADFALSELRREDGRLWKRWRAGAAGLDGVLEDYAFLVWGLIELWEATFDARYLEAAIELNATMIAHFADAEGGGFYTASDDVADLIVRVKDAYDGALPSGNSVAALNLLRLARITGDTALEERFTDVAKAFSGRVADGPTAFSQLLCALDFAIGPAHEVVVVGRAGAPDTKALLAALAQDFLPNAVVLFVPAGEPEPAIARLAPWTAGHEMRAERATAYVCRAFACLAPVTDVAAMRAGLAGPDPALPDPDAPAGIEPETGGD